MSQRQRFIESHPLLSIFAALASVTAFGTLGFMQLEGWSPARALYFTLISITTVGYGDEGVSETGRGFALVLILGGMGVASYAMMQLVTAAANAPPYWRRRMQKCIEHARDHTIVCGYGRMGQTIANQLSAAGRTVVVVEAHEAAFDAALSANHLAIHGAATEDSVLEKAGIARASSLVSCVDSELENIAVTLSARALQSNLVIVARAEEEQQVRKLHRAGATRVVSPFQSGGNEAAQMILNPHVADFLSHSFGGSGSVALAEIEIEEGSALAGVTLAEYGRGEGVHLSFVALTREDRKHIIPPRGSEEMQAGDMLIVAGEPGQVHLMSTRALGS